MKSLRVVLLVIGFFSAMVPLRAQESNPPKAKKRPSVYDELKEAPEKARAKHNPLENDPEAPIAGGILFEQHCSECHGEKGEGSRRGPSLRAAPIQNAEPGVLFWVLTNGVVRRGMPVWSKLPEPQRWQIVSFIKSFTTAAKPATADSQPDAVTESPSRRR